MFRSQGPCLYIYIHIGWWQTHIEEIQNKVNWLQSQTWLDCITDFSDKPRLERMIRSQITKTSANTRAMSLDNNKVNTPNTLALMCQRNYTRTADTRSRPRTDWHLSFWTWGLGYERTSQQLSPRVRRFEIERGPQTEEKEVHIIRAQI